MVLHTFLDKTLSPRHKCITVTEIINKLKLEKIDHKTFIQKHQACDLDLKVMYGVGDHTT